MQDGRDIFRGQKSAQSKYLCAAMLKSCRMKGVGNHHFNASDVASDDKTKATLNFLAAEPVLPGMVVPVYAVCSRILALAIIL